MTTTAQRVLYWAPRALSIAFIGFVSLFALDVFNEGRGFRETLAALAIHLIPSFAMIAMLVVAWRWEWTGTFFFTAAGIFFLIITRPNWQNKLLLASPAFVTAALFLANWLQRTNRPKPPDRHLG